MALPWNVKPADILGMEQDEFKKKLDSAVSKEDIAALKDELSQSMSNTLGPLVEQLKALKATADPAPIVPDPDPSDDATKILTNPRGFIADETKGIQTSQQQTQAELNELRARNRYPGAFTEYSQELMDTASKFPLSQRAQPGFWDWHIRTIIGDKVVKGDIRAGKFPTLLGQSSTSVNADGGNPKDPNMGVAPDMADWLRNKGVPIDKAAAIYKHMVQDGEQITLESYKKAVKEIGVANA